MFCFFHKWFISRTLDVGNRLPGFVSRHLGHCRECRDFYRLSGSLAPRLSHDAAEFLLERKDLLDERINSALASRREPEQNREPVFNRRRTPLFAPVPLLAAALLVLAVAIGLILQTIPPGTTGNDQNPFSSLSEIRLGKTSLPEIIGRVESPIESEMTGLKQTVNSATEFLLSCLDIKINRE